MRSPTRWVRPRWLTPLSGEARGSGSISRPIRRLLAVGSERQVTIVDDGAFMSGIALAAAIDVVAEETAPVWESALVCRRRPPWAWSWPKTGSFGSC